MFLFLVFGCEKEEPFEEAPLSAQENGYVVKTVHKKELRANTQLFELLQNQAPSNQNAQGRPVESGDGNIVFNDEYGKYIQYGDYHSYTFAVTNTPKGEGLENVVFLSQNEGGYLVLLGKYDLTEAEIEKLAAQEPLEIEPRNVQFIVLDQNYETTGTTSNMLHCVWVVKTFCSYGNHDHGIEEDGSPCPGFSVGSDRVCESSGGGNGSIPHFDPQTYNPNPNGGGAGNGGVTTPVVIRTTRLEDVLACLAGPVPYGEDPLLSPEVLAWLNEDVDQNEVLDNFYDVRDIGNFVEENNCSPEAAAFGALAAEALYEGGEVDFDDRILSYLPVCQQDILNDIQSISDGKISEIIASFSNNDTQNPFNWKIGQTSQNGPQLAHTDPNITTIASGNYAVTNLNVNRISNATDLLVAQTIMHEAIHAYIVNYYYNNPWNLTSGQSDLENYTYGEMVSEYIFGNLSMNDAQHNQFIRDNMVYHVKIALKKYGQLNGYSLSDTFYENLAWAGLQETDNYEQQLSAARRHDIELMLEAERTSQPNGNVQPQGQEACD